MTKTKDPIYFSLKQLKAIELLAEGALSHGEIAGQIGVNPNTITRWKKDPKFMHAIVMRARKMLKEDLPLVYKSLSKQSIDGSAQHIRIMLDHLDALDNAHAGQTTVSFTWKSETPAAEEKPDEYSREHGTRPHHDG